MFPREEYIGHFYSGEALWLQEEAALQMHSFRDAEPQPVIPQDPKKNHGKPLKQHPLAFSGPYTYNLCCNLKNISLLYQMSSPQKVALSGPIMFTRGSNHYNCVQL